MITPIVLQFTLIVIFLAAEYLTMKHGQYKHPLMRIAADEIMHVLFFASTAFPLIGNRYFIWGIIASVLIDVDHFISARSFLPEKTLNLVIRPISHSLIFALGVLLILFSLGLPYAGIFIFMGLLSHLLRDLISGSTPLFYPLVKRMHIGFALFACLAAVLGAVNAGISIFIQ